MIKNDSDLLLIAKSSAVKVRNYEAEIRRGGFDGKTSEVSVKKALYSMAGREKISVTSDVRGEFVALFWQTFEVPLR